MRAEGPPPRRRRRRRPQLSFETGEFLFSRPSASINVSPSPPPPPPTPHHRLPPERLECNVVHPPRSPCRLFFGFRFFVRAEDEPPATSAFRATCCHPPAKGNVDCANDCCENLSYNVLKLRANSSVIGLTTFRVFAPFGTT